MGLVDYIYATEDELPEIPAGCLFQYVTGKHGVYLRAARKGLEVCLLLESRDCQMRGLHEVRPYIWIVERVSENWLRDLLKYSRQALPNEILFYLRYKPTPGHLPWQALIPNQIQTPASVHPVNPYPDKNDSALIEVHSHGVMRAWFSKTDDREETGFRVYSILGTVGYHPTIITRIGVYGYWFPIASHYIYEIPDGIMDGLNPFWNKAEAEDDHSTTTSQRFLDF